MQRVDRAVSAADHEKMAIDQPRVAPTQRDTCAPSRITRLVVDLDLDEQGARAISWASRFARDLRVPIVAWVMVQNRSSERSIEIERRFEADTAAATHRWLLARDVVIDELHIGSGIRNDDLVASTGRGDIVILGVRRSEGLSEWALGSHAHQLVHALRCPLIIVPPGDRAADDAPVVVGVDGTLANGRVLDWATGLAGALHREIVPVFAYKALYDTCDNAESSCDDKQAAAPGAAALPGHPAQVLTDVSLNTAAFLTVVGARNAHALRGLLVGGVVDHLLHHPPRPVAIYSYGAMHDADDEIGAR